MERDCGDNLAPGPSAAAALNLQTQPQLLHHLGRALSVSVTQNSASSTVAAALLSLFPSVEYLTFHREAGVRGRLVASENLAREGSFWPAVADQHASLASLCYTARVMASTTSNLLSREHFLDLDGTFKKWSKTYHVCIPLLLDDRLGVVEASLRADVLDTPAQQPALLRIVQQYAASTTSARCLGTLTIAARDVYAFDDGNMANACLLASVVALHLNMDLGVPSEPARMLSPRVDSSTDSGSASSSDVGCDEHMALSDVAPSSLARGRLVGTSLSPPTIQSSGTHQGGTRARAHLPPPTAAKHASSLLVVEDSADCKPLLSERTSQALQHPWLLHFLQPTLEQEYMQWFSVNFLLVQRLFHMSMGLPWIVLAGVKKPWLLLENAVWVWALLVVYTALQGCLLWFKPHWYRHSYLRFAIMGWATTSWFFLANVGSVPMRYLSQAQLQGLPWFAMQSGMLTNTIVAVFYLVPFRFFLPLQAISLLANANNVVALCGTCCGGAALCYIKATVIHVLICMLMVGGLVYCNEHRLRSVFLHQHKHLMQAAQAMRATA